MAETEYDSGSGMNFNANTMVLRGGSGATTLQDMATMNAPQGVSRHFRAPGANLTENIILLCSNRFLVLKTMELRWWT